MIDLGIYFWSLYSKNANFAVKTLNQYLKVLSSQVLKQIFFIWL